MTEHVTGVVLAGGRSQRFGGDKARYVLDGRPMIAHVVELVSTLCDVVLVSIGADTPAFPLEGVRYARDRYPGAGPLAGLHAGLEAAASPWVLAVACDMPFLTRRALHELLSARTAGVQAVVAEDAHGRLHPLCACYRTELLPATEAYLEDGCRRMHAFLGGLRTTRTVLLPAEVLRNINRPSDLRPAARDSDAS